MSLSLISGDFVSLINLWLNFFTNNFIYYEFPVKGNLQPYLGSSKNIFSLFFIMVSRENTIEDF